MKYASVIAIWLWANLILIITAPIIFFIHYYLKEETNGKLYDVFLHLIITTLFGFLVTIPSLIIRLVFHSFFSGRTLDVRDYLKLYCFLILFINVIYFVVFKLFYKPEYITGSFIQLPITYILTSAAGLVGLSIEYKRIKKRVVD